MSEVGTARVRVPERAKRGEVIEIRAMIEHPMESGFRLNNVGKPIPRHIVERFTVTYAGEEVFSMDLTQGVAANPFIAFSTIATQTGELVFTWEDDLGETVTVSKTLTVTG
jgi:sulfur-oxidizing protein SoxZ